MCGAGSIGRRHIKNIRTLGHDVIVWRFREEVRQEFATDPNVLFAYNLKDAMSNADAVVIATSTDSHLDIAEQAVMLGKHFFLEKPVSHNLALVEQISREVAEKELIVEVGCQLRFHPGLQALKYYLDKDDVGPLYAFQFAVGQRLDQWRPGVDYRRCYSSDRKRGGGALLDLIHEVDLVLWLLGRIEEVFAVQSTISDLHLNADDLTNLTFIMENGGVGQVQMDMVSSAYRRHFELVFQKVIYRWDYVSGHLVRLDNKGEDILHTTESSFNRNVMFMDHMQHFISQVQSNIATPVCSFDDGVIALKVALAAQVSAATNRKIPIS